MEQSIKDALKCNYKAELLIERPGSATPPLLYFTDRLSKGGKDGLIVKVTLNNNTNWTGMFAFGDYIESGLYTTPNPDQLCVLSKGIGYLVNTDTPSIWQVLPIYPVHEAFQIKDTNLLILSNFTDIYAFDKDGIAWQSNSLVSDNLVIQSVCKEQMIGKASINGKPIRFILDVNNGNLIAIKTRGTELNDEDLRDLVDTWIRVQEYEIGTEEHNRESWAIEEEMDLAQNSILLWKFILLAYKKPMSARAESIFAAGPLETIISDYGEQYIQEIEKLARTDLRFKDLLGGVWKSHTPDHIWERVQAVRGKSWDERCCSHEEDSSSEEQ